MKFIAYLSKPIDPSTIDQTLEDIYESSLKNNAKNDISGVLFYTGKNFVQIMEGPANSVDDLMKIIEADKRHCDIEFLYTNSSHSRSLKDWNMQPLNLTHSDQFNSSTLKKAIEIVSSTMKLDADGFVYLVSEMLNDSDFQKILNA